MLLRFVHPLNDSFGITFTPFGILNSIIDSLLKLPIHLGSHVNAPIHLQSSNVPGDILSTDSGIDSTSNLVRPLNKSFGMSFVPLCIISFLSAIRFISANSLFFCSAIRFISANSLFFCSSISLKVACSSSLIFCMHFSSSPFIAI